MQACDSDALAHKEEAKEQCRDIVNAKILSQRLGTSDLRHTF